jgi:predicted acyltransferase
MQNERIGAIDRFRGFAILSMVLANFMGGVQVIPAWLKHAPDIGLTVIDLIAPFFIFAIGLTFGPSFRRRMQRDGAARTYGHFAVRNLALLGIGAILSAGETALGVNTNGVDWGVLQAIGAAGLLTLAVIRLPAAWRAVIGATLLLVYQFALERGMLAGVLASPHGGLFGALSWAAMLVLATCLADMYHESGRSKWFFWTAVLVCAGGAALALLSPVSKNRVSATYVMVSLGASGMLFWSFHVLEGKLPFRSGLLDAWGRNPLALYLAHFLLLGLVYLPDQPGLYAQAPLWLAILEMVLLVLALSGLAIWLKKKRIVLSL